MECDAKQWLEKGIDPGRDATFRHQRYQDYLKYINAAIDSGDDHLLDEIVTMYIDEAFVCPSLVKSLYPDIIEAIIYRGRPNHFDVLLKGGELSRADVHPPSTETMLRILGGSAKPKNPLTLLALYELSGIQDKPDILSRIIALDIAGGGHETLKAAVKGGESITDSRPVDILSDIFMLTIRHNNKPALEYLISETLTLDISDRAVNTITNSISLGLFGTEQVFNDSLYLLSSFMDPDYGIIQPIIDSDTFSLLPTSRFVDVVDITMRDAGSVINQDRAYAIMSRVLTQGSEGDDVKGKLEHLTHSFSHMGWMDEVLNNLSVSVLSRPDLNAILAQSSVSPGAGRRSPGVTSL